MTLVTCLSCPTLSQAQDLQYPIDKVLDECLENTDRMATGCYAEALEAWDAELNRVYQELRVILSPEEKDRLLAAQRAWLAYRDAEFLFTDDFYQHMQGYYNKQEASVRRMSLIRERALQLKVYLNDKRANE